MGAARGHQHVPDLGPIVTSRILANTWLAPCATKDPRAAARAVRVSPAMYVQASKTMVDPIACCSMRPIHDPSHCELPLRLDAAIRRRQQTERCSTRSSVTQNLALGPRHRWQDVDPRCVDARLLDPPLPAAYARVTITPQAKAGLFVRVSAAGPSHLGPAFSFLDHRPTTGR